MLREKIGVGLMMICTICPKLLADQIILKNGDRLTGTIIKSDDKSLSLKSEFAGTVMVQWDASGGRGESVFAAAIHYHDRQLAIDRGLPAVR